MSQVASVVLSNLAERSTLLLVLAVVFSTSYLLPRLRIRQRLDQIPLMGQEIGGYYKRRNEFLRDPMRFYWEGYQKCKNKAFRVTHYEGERIVLPGTALDELWNMSEAVLNKNRAYDQSIETIHWVAIRQSFSSPLHPFRLNTKSELEQINNTLVSEVEKTVDQTIGTCEDWTSHPIYRTSLRIVAIVSGSVYVGPIVCRNEQFIHDSSKSEAYLVFRPGRWEYLTYNRLAVHFTENVLTAVHMLQMYPGWMRPFARFFKRERTQLAKSWAHLKASKKLVMPIIQQRREEVQATGAEYNDMLAWMMAKQEEWKQTDDDLAGSMVQLGVASTHNTSSTIAQTLYQLAIRPELVKELREEVKRVCAQFDGKLSPSALHELKILDSVMKEAQRLNPTTPSHFHRYVEKDITLKDGTFIPKGITVEAIFAPPLFDPVLFPDPQKFDPYRFLKLRRGETQDPNGYKNKEQYTFSHATKENLAWGYGAHVCPGRYFANNEIKLILARMILQYDIRMPGGVNEEMKPQRAGMGWVPNLRKPIEFRAVKEEA
ncbi:Cytochrome p450 [Colletotrichum higginsianum IMI 349063]|uniref:Cytochrome p450 n=1 Tax=Colletotrichum higginsianum (strain IMI 349063) TaxID=759273 RepID=A0A1B7XYN1_COLHI|nr:Cytochrome p450 [Colletotrichum higginsianum IMI 349063]OBR04854.1 Cytochrome p450 [Colletotrichum higginsianum IMI 349063]